MSVRFQYAAIAEADETVTVSVDEMTGIQALERLAPSLPMRPGKVERRGSPSMSGMERRPHRRPMPPAASPA